MPYEDSESEESSGGEEGIKHFWFDKKQKQISILTCIFFGTGSDYELRV